MEEKKNKKVNKVKNFFKRFAEKIDKKMTEKAKGNSCCYAGNKKENKSCCS